MLISALSFGLWWWYNDFKAKLDDFMKKHQSLQLSNENVPFGMQESYEHLVIWSTNDTNGF